MSENSIVAAVAILVLMAHLAAFAWLAWTGGDVRPVLCCNVAVAVVILGYQLSRRRYLLVPPVDQEVVDLVAFEAAVLLMSGWSFHGRRAAVIASSAACAVHLVASAAAVLFVLTFRMTRLF